MTRYSWKLGTAIIPKPIWIITKSYSCIVLGTFEWVYSIRAVSFTYISLSERATVCAALPVYTGEIVVSGVSGGSAGDVASVIWFGN